MRVGVPRCRIFALLVLAIAVVVSLDISLALAHSGDSDGPTAARSDYSALAQVPEKARAKSNPFEDDADARAAGGKLFERHCAGCHGANAAGGKKGANLRAEEVRQATPGALFWVLTNGVVRRGMPVWSKLPEPQRWQLVAFLKTLGASRITSAPKLVP